MVAHKIHKISQKDVGETVLKVKCPTCGTIELINLVALMGGVFDHDIGKRIYRVAPGEFKIEGIAKGE